MFHIAICEDDSAYMEVMEYLIKKYNEKESDKIRAHCFYNGNELLKSMDNGMYSAFLLDIIMPEKNGIELAKEIRARDNKSPLIFLTSSVEFALEAYGVSALQYIIKPVTEETLFPLLKKIISEYENTEQNFLLFSAIEYKIKISFSDIICIESYNHSIRIFLNEGREMISKTLKESYEKSIVPILSDKRFLHPHKSFVINMDYIEKITSDKFILTNGIEVPIPRYKYAEAKNKYLDYAASKENFKII